MERYRRLVESSPDGIVVLHNEQIAYANAAAVELFGVTALDQLVGRSLVDVLDPENLEAVREQLRKWARGDAASLDARISRPDRPSRDVSVSGAPLQHDTERSLQVVVRDI